MFLKKSWKMAGAAMGLVATLGLTACSTPDTRNDPAPLLPISNPTSDPSIVWQTPVGQGTTYGFAPAITGDTIYAAAANGVVSRVNLSDGGTVWSKTVANRLSAGVGTDGNTVVVVDDQGEVIALDSNGEEKWRTRASSEVDVVPWVGKGVVLIVAGDYRVQAFNAENGERLWNVQRPGPSLALRAPSRMTTLQDLVIVGMPGGRLMAVEPIIGSVVWEGIVAVPEGFSDLDRVTDVVGIPIVRGNALCAVAYQGRVTCFDAEHGGDTMWNQRVSSIVGMGASDTTLFVPNARGSLIAYAIEDGEIQWRQDVFRNRKLTEPAVSGQTLAVGDFEGQVHLLKTDSGEVSGRIAVGGGAMFAPAQATSRGVLVQAGDSSLAMIQVR